MSRYIDADYIKALMINSRLMQGNCEYKLWIQEVDRQVDSMPYSIDLADYVPKDFHNKTCEAMAKAHQEEIVDMVRVVRCEECKHYTKRKFTDGSGEIWEEDVCDHYNLTAPLPDDYCSYGKVSEKLTSSERSSE